MRTIFKTTVCALVMTVGGVCAYGGEVLGGIEGLACEAILCLSSSARPSECNRSLNHYYGINHKKWSKTVRERKAFLNRCPTVEAPGMESLVDAIANGAGGANVTQKPSAYYTEDGKRIEPNYYNVVDGSGAAAYRNHEWTDLDDLRGLYIKNPRTGEYQKAIHENGKTYLEDPVTGERTQYYYNMGQYVACPVGYGPKQCR